MAFDLEQFKVAQGITESFKAKKGIAENKIMNAPFVSDQKVRDTYGEDIANAFEINRLAVKEATKLQEDNIETRQQLLDIKNLQLQNKRNPYVQSQNLSNVLNPNTFGNMIGSNKADLSKLGRLVQNERERELDAQDFETQRMLSILGNLVQQQTLGLEKQAFEMKQEQAIRELNERTKNALVNMNIEQGGKGIISGGITPEAWNFVPNDLLSPSSHLGALKEVGSYLGQSLAGGVDRIIEGTQQLRGALYNNQDDLEDSLITRQRRLDREKQSYKTNEFDNLSDLGEQAMNLNLGKAARSLINQTVPAFINDEILPSVIAPAQMTSSKAFELAKANNPGKSDKEILQMFKDGSIYEDMKDAGFYTALNYASEVLPFVLPYGKVAGNTVSKGILEASQASKATTALDRAMYSTRVLGKENPVLGSIVGESITEGAQGFIENYRDPTKTKEQKEKEIAEGAILGGLSAGAISAPSKTKKVATSAPETIRSIFESKQAKESREKAKAEERKTILENRIADSFEEVAKGNEISENTARYNALKGINDLSEAEIDANANTILASGNKKNKDIVREALLGIQNGEVASNPIVRKVQEKLLEQEALGNEAITTKEHRNSIYDSFKDNSTIAEGKQNNVDIAEAREAGFKVQDDTNENGKISTVGWFQETDGSVWKESNHKDEIENEVSKIDDEVQTHLETLENYNELDEEQKAQAAVDFLSNSYVINSRVKLAAIKKYLSSKGYDFNKLAEARKAKEAETVEPTSNNEVKSVEEALNSIELYEDVDEQGNAVIKEKDRATIDAKTRDENSERIAEAINSSSEDKSNPIDPKVFRNESIESRGTAIIQKIENEQDREATFDKFIENEVALAGSDLNSARNKALIAALAKIISSIYQSTEHRGKLKKGKLLKNMLEKLDKTPGLADAVLDAVAQSLSDTSYVEAASDNKGVSKSLKSSTQVSGVPTQAQKRGADLLQEFTADIERALQDKSSLVNALTKYANVLRRQLGSTKVSMPYVSALEQTTFQKSLARIKKILNNAKSISKELLAQQVSEAFLPIKRIYDNLAVKKAAYTKALNLLKQNLANSSMFPAKYLIKPDRTTNSTVVVFKVAKDDASNISFVSNEEFIEHNNRLGTDKNILEIVRDLNSNRTSPFTYTYVDLSESESSKEAIFGKLEQAFSVFVDEQMKAFREVETSLYSFVSKVQQDLFIDADESSSLIQKLNVARTAKDVVDIMYRAEQHVKKLQKDVNNFANKKNKNETDIIRFVKLKNKLQHALKLYNSLLARIEIALPEMNEEQAQALRDFLDLREKYTKVVQEHNKYSETDEKKGIFQTVVAKTMQLIKDVLKGTIARYNQALKQIKSTKAGRELLNHVANKYKLDTKLFNEQKLGVAKIDLFDVSSVYNTVLGTDEISKANRSFTLYSGNAELKSLLLENFIENGGFLSGFFNYFTSRRMIMPDLRKLATSYDQTKKLIDESYITDLMKGIGNNKVSFSSVMNSDFQELFESTYDKEGNFNTRLKDVFKPALALATIITSHKIRNLGTYKDSHDNIVQATSNYEAMLAREFLKLIGFGTSKGLSSAERTQLENALGATLTQLVTPTVNTLKSEHSRDGIFQKEIDRLYKDMKNISELKDVIGDEESFATNMQDIWKDLKNIGFDNGLFVQESSDLTKEAIISQSSMKYDIRSNGVMKEIVDMFNDSSNGEAVVNLILKQVKEPVTSQDENGNVTVKYKKGYQIVHNAALERAFSMIRDIFLDDEAKAEAIIDNIKKAVGIIDEKGQIVKSYLDEETVQYVANDPNENVTIEDINFTDKFAQELMNAVTILYLDKRVPSNQNYIYPKVMQQTLGRLSADGSLGNIQSNKFLRQIIRYFPDMNKVGDYKYTKAIKQFKEKYMKTEEDIALLIAMSADAIAPARMSKKLLNKVKKEKVSKFLKLLKDPNVDWNNRSLSEKVDILASMLSNEHFTVGKTILQGSNLVPVRAKLTLGNLYRLAQTIEIGQDGKLTIDPRDLNVELDGKAFGASTTSAVFGINSAQAIAGRRGEIMSNLINQLQKNEVNDDNYIAVGIEFVKALVDSFNSNERPALFEPLDVRNFFNKGKLDPEKIKEYVKSVIPEKYIDSNPLTSFLINELITNLFPSHLNVTLEDLGNVDTFSLEDILNLDQVKENIRQKVGKPLLMLALYGSGILANAGKMNLKLLEDEVKKLLSETTRITNDNILASIYQANPNMFTALLSKGKNLSFDSFVALIDAETTKGSDGISITPSGLVGRTKDKEIRPNGFVSNKSLIEQMTNKELEELYRNVFILSNFLQIESHNRLQQVAKEGLTSEHLDEIAKYSGKAFEPILTDVLSAQLGYNADLMEIFRKAHLVKNYTLLINMLDKMTVEERGGKKSTELLTYNPETQSFELDVTHLSMKSLTTAFNKTISEIQNGKNQAAKELYGLTDEQFERSFVANTLVTFLSNTFIQIKNKQIEKANLVGDAVYSPTTETGDSSINQKKAEEKILIDFGSTFIPSLGQALDSRTIQSFLATWDSSIPVNQVFDAVETSMVYADEAAKNLNQRLTEIGVNLKENIIYQLIKGIEGQIETLAHQYEAIGLLAKDVEEETSDMQSILKGTMELMENQSKVREATGVTTNAFSMGLETEDGTIPSTYTLSPNGSIDFKDEKLLNVDQYVSVAKKLTKLAKVLGKLGMSITDIFSSTQRQKTFAFLRDVVTQYNQYTKQLGLEDKRDAEWLKLTPNQLTTFNTTSDQRITEVLLAMDMDVLNALESFVDTRPIITDSSSKLGLESGLYNMSKFNVIYNKVKQHIKETAFKGLTDEQRAKLSKSLFLDNVTSRITVAILNQNNPAIYPSLGFIEPSQELVQFYASGIVATKQNVKDIADAKNVISTESLEQANPFLELLEELGKEEDGNHRLADLIVKLIGYGLNYGSLKTITGYDSTSDTASEVKKLNAIDTLSDNDKLVLLGSIRELLRQDEEYINQITDGLQALGLTSSISNTEVIEEKVLNNLFNAKARNLDPTLVDGLTELLRDLYATYIDYNNIALVASKTLENIAPNQLFKSNSYKTNFLVPKATANPVGNVSGSRPVLSDYAADVESFYKEIEQATEADLDAIADEFTNLEPSNASSSKAWIKERFKEFIKPFAKGINIVVTKGSRVELQGFYRDSDKTVGVHLTQRRLNNQTPMEIYMHEVTHSIMDFAENSTDPRIRGAYKELGAMRKAWVSFLRSREGKTLKASLIAKMNTTEAEFDENILNYIGQDDDIRGMKEFVAFMNSNETLLNSLNALPKQKLGLKDRFMNIVRMIYNIVFGTDYVIKNADTAYMFNSFYMDIARANAGLVKSVSASAIGNKIRYALNRFDEITGIPLKKVGRNYGKVINKHIEAMLEKPRINKVEGTVFTVLGYLCVGNKEIAPNVLNLATKTWGDGNALAQQVGNAIGYDKAFNEAKGRVTMIDKRRNDMIATTKELAMSGFNTKPSVREQQALTRLIKMTDLSSIQLDPSALAELLQRGDKANIEARINNLTKRLKDMNGMDINSFKFIDELADNLAYFMVNGETKGYTLTNAVNIALQLKPTRTKVDLDMTDYKYNMQETIGIIDELVSYKALKLMPSEEFEVIKATETKGIEQVIKTAKMVNDKARRELAVVETAGKKTYNISNFAKGYVRRDFDKGVAFKLGYSKDSKDMATLGYKAIKGFKTINPDTAEQDVVVYASTSEFHPTFNQGMIRAINGKSRGHTLATLIRRNNREATEHEINSLVKASMQDISMRMYDYKDRRWSNSNLIPVFDSRGFVADYKIVIPNKTKDSLGMQETSIFDALGDELANLWDKEESLMHNKQFIDAAEAYYEANKNKYKFIEIDPVRTNSTNEDFVDLYHNMSLNLQTYVNEKYKGKFHIRADMVHEVFGYESFQFVKDIDDKKANKAIPLVVRRAGRIVEGFTKKMASLNKTRIVMKHGGVVAGNITSNISTLLMYDVPLNQLVPSLLDAAKGLEAYYEDMNRIAKITVDMQLTEDTAKQASLQDEINRINKRWESTDIGKLAKGGLMTDIVESREFMSEIENKDFMDKKFDQFMMFLNPKQRKVLKEALMTEDSKGFELMKTLVTNSDLLFKVVLYKNRRKAGVNEAEALSLVERAFVNYSHLGHPIFKFASDIGLVMFPRFYLNIVKFITHDMLSDKAGRILAGYLIGLLGKGMLETPFDGSILRKLIMGDNLLYVPLWDSIMGIAKDPIAIDNFVPYIGD